MCGPRPLGLPRRAEGRTGCSLSLGPTAGGARVRRCPSRARRRRWSGGGVSGSLAAPSPTRPAPGAKPPALPRGAGLQRCFEEGSEFRGLSGWPGAAAEEGLGEGGGRRGAGLRVGAARSGPPGSAAVPRGRLPGTPQGLALSPPGSPPVRCQFPPAAASQSPTSPAPRSLSSSLDSAWGFAGFWEIKTASNSGGALPGQTGPGGPCAPGYGPRAGAPGFGAPGKGRRAKVQAPRLPRSSRLPKWGIHWKVSESVLSTASVSCPGRREGPQWRPPAKSSAPPGRWVTVTVSLGPPRPLVKLVGSALGPDLSLPRICQL